MKDFDDHELGAWSSDFEFKRPLFKTSKISKISHPRNFCNLPDLLRSIQIKTDQEISDFRQSEIFLDPFPFWEFRPEFIFLPKIDYFWTETFQKREFSFCLKIWIPSSLFWLKNRFEFQFSF